jgi:methylated-DNA-[protein]-cysteine S-methyltransferase
MFNFSEKVFKIVRKIPRGGFLTYNEVAKLAGRPWAWRAVGNILSKNKNPQIPCHRVIKSNGKVGGYRHGTKKKIALLRKEGIITDYHGKVTSRSPKQRILV